MRAPSYVMQRNEHLKENHAILTQAVFVNIRLRTAAAAKKKERVHFLWPLFTRKRQKSRHQDLINHRPRFTGPWLGLEQSLQNTRDVGKNKH